MDTQEIVGRLERTGRLVVVIRAASGSFWTARCPFIGDRDFRTRGAAVRHLKRILSDPSLGVQWQE